MPDEIKICTEEWADEVGCEPPATTHRCEKALPHRTHPCCRCDAMVIDDVDYVGATKATP